MPKIPPCVAIDTETTGLSVWEGGRMFAAAAAFHDGTRKFWRDDFTGLREILLDPMIDKVFHNAKFDMRHLEWKGLIADETEIGGQVWDTMIFCHLLDGRQGGHGGKNLRLDAVTQRYIPAMGRKVIKEIEDWFDEHDVPKRERWKHFDRFPNELLKKRCVGDAELTLWLFQRIYPTVAATFPFLLEQEHKVLMAVKRLEDRGIQVDHEEIETQIKEYDAITEDVQAFCEGITGDDQFNLNSRAQQMAMLKQVGVLHLIKGKTPTGQPKLDDYNLRQIEHPVPHMLLLGKAAVKMRDTFLDQMLRYSVPDGDGGHTLHPQFNQLGTKTGRFSGSNPNLMNIPIEGDHRTAYTEDEATLAFEMTQTEYRPHIKRVFICRPGFAHIHSDKIQAEMYMLGHYCNDPKMLALFSRGESIHNAICRMLYGEWTKGLKMRTKAVVFGYQYGASLKVIAQKIGGTIAEAASVKRRLAATLPGLPRFQRRLAEEIEERGYVETIHGRRHYLSRNEVYMAVNRMCQGTVADEIKSRMVAIDEWAQSEKNGVQILLNVHDDLGTEVPIDDVHRTMPVIYEIMNDSSPGHHFNLDLPADLNLTATRWADLQDVPDPRDTEHIDAILETAWTRS